MPNHEFNIPKALHYLWFQIPKFFTYYIDVNVLRKIFSTIMPKYFSSESSIPFKEGTLICNFRILSR